MRGMPYQIVQLHNLTIKREHHLVHSRGGRKFMNRINNNWLSNLNISKIFIRIYIDWYEKKKAGSWTTILVLGEVKILLN